jgi:predicted small lipoprotein YifL
MKNTFLSLSMAFALFTITACTEKKGTIADEDPAAVEVVDATATDVDSTAIPATEETEPKEEVITVSGNVTEINQGKDGYTAKIKTTEGKFYFATISIPNMADPKQYKSVKIGESITVTGESFPVEEDVMIKVTSLK